MAKLYFKYGAMNSGKTTILLQTAHNYEERGMKIVLLKPSIDTKGENKIVSRLGVERKVDYLINENDSIYNIIDGLNDISCILVDEAQFLTVEQVDELLKVVIEKDIPVICYGLRTDFKTKAFPASIRLFELAQKLEELKTICECGSKATFNARFINDEIVIDGDQVVIDNNQEVEYRSMCPKCYYKRLKKNY